MPYISDAERERARWITLAEVIAHIVKHDGCDRDSALKQLRNALGDRKLRIKWDKEPLRLSPYILYAHRPPECASFWQRARVDDDDKVLDPETENWRTLLILKDDVFQFWPEPSVASAASESRKADRTTKAKRLSHAEIEILQAFDRLLARLNLKDLKSMSQKERATAVEKECGEKFDERTVAKYFQIRLGKHRTDT